MSIEPTHGSNKHAVNADFNCDQSWVVVPEVGGMCDGRDVVFLCY